MNIAFLLIGLVLPFKRARKKAKTVLKILREYRQVAQKVSTKTFVNTLSYSNSLFRDSQPTVLEFLALVA